MHETEGKEFNYSETDITFETIYSKDYFPSNIPEVRNANALLIPNENLRKNIGITFPETTIEFYEYLKENENDIFKPDIAVKDEDFKKLNLHSALVPLVTIICTSVVLPIVLNLVSSFLYDLAKKYLRKEDELSAEVNILVEETKESKSIQLHYKGPVKGLEKTMSAGALKAFKDMYVMKGDGIELKEAEINKADSGEQS